MNIQITGVRWRRAVEASTRALVRKAAGCRRAERRLNKIFGLVMVGACVAVGLPTMFTGCVTANSTGNSLNYQIQGLRELLRNEENKAVKLADERRKIERNIAALRTQPAGQQRETNLRNQEHERQRVSSEEKRARDEINRLQRELERKERMIDPYG
jgi:chromosome segregation ATPase